MLTLNPVSASSHTKAEVQWNIRGTRSAGAVREVILSELQVDRRHVLCHVQNFAVTRQKWLGLLAVTPPGGHLRGHGEGRHRNGSSVAPRGQTEEVRASERRVKNTSEVLRLVLVNFGKISWHLSFCVCKTPVMPSHTLEVRQASS